MDLANGDGSSPLSLPDIFQNVRRQIFSVGLQACSQSNPKEPVANGREPPEKSLDVRTYLLLPSQPKPVFYSPPSELAPNSLPLLAPNAYIVPLDANLPLRRRIPYIVTPSTRTVYHPPFTRCILSLGSLAARVLILASMTTDLHNLRPRQPNPQ